MQQHANNTRPRAGAQVADDSGESDLQFFRGRSFLILVVIQRDSTGEPGDRARGIIFVDGGTA